MLGNDMTLADFVSILVLISYYFLVLGIETEDKKNNVRTLNNHCLIKAMALTLTKWAIKGDFVVRHWQCADN